LVAGINDGLNQPNIPVFCGSCDVKPDVGNHSVKALLNVVIADAGANKPAVRPNFRIAGFYLALRGHGSGRAMITGNCADIGKVKGPILRGLPARRPISTMGRTPR
jgi:cytochrome c peroxidase